MFIYSRDLYLGAYAYLLHTLLNAYAYTPYVKYMRVPFVICDSFTVQVRRREKSRNKTEKKKKKRGRDSHAEQYKPSDRDFGFGLWKMATRGASDEDPSSAW
jgi:hypothetical protein